MSERSNAQVALESATILCGGLAAGGTTFGKKYVLDIADEYLEWLDKKTTT